MATASVMVSRMPPSSHVAITAYGRRHRSSFSACVRHMREREEREEGRERGRGGKGGREDRDTHTTHTCTDAAGKFDTQTRSAYHHMQFFGSVIRACLWAESPATSPEKNSPEKEAHMENPRDTLAEAEKVVKRKMLP